MALTLSQWAITGAACAGAELAGCSGRSVGGASLSGAKVGGTSAGEQTPNLAGEASNLVLFAYECEIPADASWDAGDWTVRFNITTSNMNLTVTEIYVCRVNSSCTNQATIGSETGLSISLGTTGVKTQVVSPGAAQTPSVGDKVLVVLIASNGAMTSQSCGITSDQNIDSPFTVVTKSLLWNPHLFLPHLVRRVREFFKPKPLFTPAPSFRGAANDLTFKKAA